VRQTKPENISISVKNRDGDIFWGLTRITDKRGPGRRLREVGLILSRKYRSEGDLRARYELDGRPWCSGAKRPGS